MEAEVNVDTKKLGEIIDTVQADEMYQFSLADVIEIATLTRRKLEINGRCEDYLYLLFENELHDFVMRKRINMNWRNEPCVRTATIPSI